MPSSRARFALASFAKDLRRRLADPLALATWLGIPALLGGSMSLAFGGSDGGTPRVRVLLADQDGGLIGKLLAGAGSAAESPLEIERVELEAGRARMEAGEASALVVLPEGFGAKVLREEPVELELVTNPAQRIGPELARGALEMLRELVFYAHRLLGEELHEIAGGEPDEARVAEMAARIHLRVGVLEGTLFPPVLRLEMEREAGGDAPSSPPIGLLLLPGLVVLALLFVANGTSEDVWVEREAGTLRRARSSPFGLAPFLAGKTAASAAVMACAAAVGLALAGAFGGVPIVRLPGALAWCALCGLSLFSLFLWIQLLASSRRGAHVLALSLLFPLMMLGGSLLPLDALPHAVVRAGSFTPNGRGAIVLKHLLAGEAGAGELARGAALVAGVGLASFALALRRLRSLAEAP